MNNNTIFIRGKERTKEILQGKKTYFMFSCFVLIALAVLIFFLWGGIPKKEITSPKKNDRSDQKMVGKNNNKCSECYRHPLNGKWIHPEEKKEDPIAISVDNHKEARPPLGLHKADVVFEAEVEGGITRYLAIFSSNDKIEKVGPVRSARPYLINWAAGVSATLVHCGGSPQALSQLAQGKVENLNEFYNPQYFYRNESRPPPHNLFASKESLNKGLNKEKEKDKDQYRSWNFKATAGTSSAKTGNKKITIGYKPPHYKVKWIYKKKKGYQRYIGGKRHKTGEGKEITADNVIIQILPAEIKDKKLRLKMDNIGEGRAIICSRGECRSGEWRKKNASQRTQYYLNNNKKAPLKPGNTWIEVARPEREINITGYEPQ